EALALYTREKLQTMLRYLVRPGVALGYGVAATSPASARVQVLPGYAVDGLGHDLYLRDAAEIDLSPLLSDAAQCGARDQVIYELCVSAAEAPQRTQEACAPWTLREPKSLTVRVTEGVQFNLRPTKRSTTALQWQSETDMVDIIPTSGTALAVATARERMFVAVEGEARLLVLDPYKKAPPTEVKLSLVPHRVEPSADASMVYAITTDGTITIDAATLTVIDQPQSNAPTAGLMLNRGAGTITDAADSIRSAIDRLTRQLLATNPSQPGAVATYGGLLFAALPGNNAVGVYDPETLERQAILPLEQHPSELAVEGDSLYVVNRGSQTISVLSLQTGQQTALLRTGAQPGRPDFDPYGRLWVPGANGITVLRCQATREPCAQGLAINTTTLTCLPLARITVAAGQTVIQTANIDCSVGRRTQQNADSVLQLLR
ncbi:MAG TPA: hypothetical protein VD973_10175, partial [Symbiobacteriaceae bacterium]|nr:hypothetical protein [Symbiobacteriaceae bacterium]